MNYKDAVRGLRARDAKAAQALLGSLLPSAAQIEALDGLIHGYKLTQGEEQGLEALAVATLQAYESNALLAEQLRVLAVYVTNIGESPYEMRQATKALLSAIVDSTA